MDLVALRHAVRLATWIERLPASALNRELDRIKAMRGECWQLTVLVELDGSDVIVLGFRVPFASHAAGDIELAS